MAMEPTDKQPFMGGDRPRTEGLLDKTRKPSRSTVPASQMLLEVPIPSDYCGIIKPMLQTLGYNVGTEKVMDFLGTERSCTLIKKDEIKRFLIYIPDEILTNPHRENMDAVIAFGNFIIKEYGKGVFLYVFHSEIPHLSYKHVIDNLWRKHLGIRAEFVALSNLLDLVGINEKIRGDYLTDMFKLDTDHLLDEKEREEIRKDLDSLNKQKNTLTKKLRHANERKMKLGSAQVDFALKDEIETTTVKIEEINKKILECEEKLRD